MGEGGAGPGEGGAGRGERGERGDTGRGARWQSTCSQLSRSRTVTVASFSDRWSTVHANGTPNSSVRAYRLPTDTAVASRA